MSEISKLIDETVALVINEDEDTPFNTRGLAKLSKLANRTFNKSDKVAGKTIENPELASATRHTAKRAMEIKHASADAEARVNTPNDGLLAKGLRKGKELVGDVDEKIKEHPYLAATTAAALAAGLGGLAAVKKMRKAADKGKKK